MKTLEINEAQLAIISEALNKFDLDSYIEKNRETLEEEGNVSWYEDSYLELISELIDMKINL